VHRFPIIVGAVALLALGGVAPVLAATPPGNDTYATRVVIGSLPFSDTVDTTAATTDALDAEAIALCEPVPTDASIWYELTATEDGPLLIDASAADYSTGILVLSGSPGAFVFEGCSAGSDLFYASAGVTYTVLVFDFQGDGGGNGGTVTVSVGDVPPAPTLELAIDPVGSFNAKTGSATVHGTITCTGDAGKAFIMVSLSQSIGRIKIQGDGFAEFTCDGTVQPWSAPIESLAGKFAGGRATVAASAVACGFDCGFADGNVTIKLRK
jgi:hypothetical protein